MVAVFFQGVKEIGYFLPYVPSQFETSSVITTILTLIRSKVERIADVMGRMRDISSPERVNQCSLPRDRMHLKFKAADPSDLHGPAARHTISLPVLPVRQYAETTRIRRLVRFSAGSLKLRP